MTHILFQMTYILLKFYATKVLILVDIQMDPSPFASNKIYSYP